MPLVIGVVMASSLAADAYAGIQKLDNTIKSLEQRLLNLERQNSEKEIVSFWGESSDSIPLKTEAQLIFIIYQSLIDFA